MWRRASLVAAAKRLSSKGHFDLNTWKEKTWKFAYGEDAPRVRRDCMTTRNQLKEKYLKLVHGDLDAWKEKIWHIAYGENAPQVRRDCMTTRNQWKAKYLELVHGAEGFDAKGQEESAHTKKDSSSSGGEEKVLKRKRMSIADFFIYLGIGDIFAKSTINLFQVRKKKIKDALEQLASTYSGYDATSEEILVRLKSMAARQISIDKKLDMLLAQKGLVTPSPKPPIVTKTLPTSTPMHEGSDDKNGEGSGNGGGNGVGNGEGNGFGVGDLE